MRGLTYPPLALQSYPYGFFKRCQGDQHLSFALLTLHVKPTLLGPHCGARGQDVPLTPPHSTQGHRQQNQGQEFRLRKQLSKCGLQTSSIYSTWLLVRTVNSCTHLRPPGPQTLGWNPAAWILTIVIPKHTNV